MHCRMRLGIGVHGLSLALAITLALLACVLPVTAGHSGLCKGRGGQNFSCPSNGCPDDCASDMFTCKGSETSLECDHVEIFQGNIGRDVGLLLLLPVFLALASAAGIGGGGIVVPILLMVGDFPPYYSVPLSVTSIVGVSVVAFAVQIRQHHPNPQVAHRPLIAFDVAVLLLPMALAGTVLGVLLNGISPDWLILATILVVLSYSSVKTVRKGMTMMRQERAAAAVKKEAGADPDANAHDKSYVVQLEQPDAGGKLQRSNIPLPVNTPDEMDSDSDNDDVAQNASLLGTASLGMLDKIRDEEARFPWTYIIITFTELAGLIVLNLLKGGSGPSVVGIECGTNAYWGMTAATFFYLILCALFGMWFVHHKYQRKVACGYAFVEGDIDFSGKTIYLYPLYAIVAGILAGFLGIGGGMVIGPLMLQFGMIPLVSSPTSAFMTLFTSISSTAQFLVLNRIPWDYGVALFVTGMIASFFGQIYLLGYVQRTGKNSLIAFVIAFIIIVATVLLLVTGAIQVKSDVEDGETFGFSPLCD